MRIDDSNISTEMSETERRSIFSSLSIIAATPYATVPYIRNLGIEEFPEDNSEFAQNEYATEVMGQVEIWEDRVTISEISFDNDNEVRMVISDDGD